MVGSHHQNEKKNQTITPGARILLPHAEIYWPKEITIIL